MPVCFSSLLLSSLLVYPQVVLIRLHNTFLLILSNYSSVAHQDSLANIFVVTTNSTPNQIPRATIVSFTTIL
jgi:hypothetical protein